MANRRFVQFFNTLHKSPVLLDCNFIVDPSQPMGVRDLRGGGIQSVQMATAAPLPPLSPDLGDAFGFQILGATTITNTGASVVNGDLGLYPGTAVIGFPPGIVNGTQHITDQAALDAKNAATAAYIDLQGRPGSVPIVGNLAGQTLLPGIYESATSADLSVGGTLILDGAGDPNAMWIFQIGSTLTLNNGSTVSLINGASAANVYWAVGSSATVGTTAVAKGNILAQVSITINTGANVSGRLFALTGAVTLDTNVAGLPLLPAVAGDIAPGYAKIILQDNYNFYFGGFNGFVSPQSGSSLLVASAGLTIGEVYVITILGTTSLAQWVVLGVPTGTTPAVGVAFVAAATSATGTGAVEAPKSNGSGIEVIDVLGDSNLHIQSTTGNIMGVNSGSYLIVRFLASTSGDNADLVATAPETESKVHLAFYLSNSKILVQGE